MTLPDVTLREVSAESHVRPARRVVAEIVSFGCSAIRARHSPSCSIRAARSGPRGSRHRSMRDAVRRRTPAGRSPAERSASLSGDARVPSSSPPSIEHDAREHGRKRRDGRTISTAGYVNDDRMQEQAADSDRRAAACGVDRARQRPVVFVVHCEQYGRPGAAFESAHHRRLLRREQHRPHEPLRGRNGKGIVRHVESRRSSGAAASAAPAKERPHPDGCVTVRLAPRRVARVDVDDRARLSAASTNAPTLRPRSPIAAGARPGRVPRTRRGDRRLLGRIGQRKRRAYRRGRRRARAGPARRRSFGYRAPAIRSPRRRAPRSTHRARSRRLRRARALLRRRANSARASDARSRRAPKASGDVEPSA